MAWPGSGLLQPWADGGSTPRLGGMFAKNASIASCCLHRVGRCCAAAAWASCAALRCHPPAAGGCPAHLVPCSCNCCLLLLLLAETKPAALPNRPLYLPAGLGAAGSPTHTTSGCTAQSWTEWSACGSPRRRSGAGRGLLPGRCRAGRAAKWCLAGCAVDSLLMCPASCLRWCRCGRFCPLPRQPHPSCCGAGCCCSWLWLLPLFVACFHGPCHAGIPRHRTPTCHPATLAYHLPN